MKKELLFSMLLLFLGGVNMRAQSVAEEQMDERFNDKKLPYGWFAEGWEVDSTGVVRTKASSGSGFDLEKLIGNNKKEEPEEPQEDPEEEPQSDPEEDPQSDPEENKGNFDLNDLLSSFMGGDSKPNYLLTPPLVVREGETLVFSARKEDSDDSGSGMSISFGASDSTFVVERSVYSQNKWERVADFTAELDTVFKTFTITGTPAGEYRFRFKAGDTAVLIDSIAGFHIDNEAPDIYIIENDARAYHIDFSLCTADSTRTLKVINTATGTLKLDINSDNATLFTVSPTQMEVAAADTMDVNITFNFAAGQPGKNESGIAFTPADERVWGKTLNMTAVVTQPGVWLENFNTNVQPKGFFTEGWVFRDNVATTSSGGGMEAMFGGGSSSFLMTPPLTVESTDEVLLFSVKSGSSDDGMAGMGGMFGGGSSSVIVEKSVYGSGKWEKMKEFTEPLDSTYRVLWVGYVEPGEYRFRIIASDSIVVDSIAGFHLDENAPDIYVLHNNTAAGAINYGMPQANSTETFAVVNTGTGSLQGAVLSTDETTFGLSTNEFAVNAGDTAFIDVTYLFDPESLGIHQAALTFSPLTTDLSPLTYPLTAYSTYADAWTEDFEPEYLREDETQPIDLPEGWETTGWEVKLPSSGGGIMDMLSGMMGGGGDAAPASWMARTSSEAYELITPRLQARKGDVLRFESELGGGGMMAMMSMFMGGGGASGQLNVYYSLDGGDNWIYYDTFVQSGYNYFVAPSSGIYRLRFTSPSASLDNFYGFRTPSGDIVNADKVTLSDGEVFDNDIETLCEEITYTRNFSNTKWQALYVPFEMSYEDWSADFEVARLNDVHQWDDDEDGLIDRTELEIVKMKSGTTQANTPYLIRAKAEGEKTITVANAILHEAEEYSIDCSSIGTLFTFTGTYKGIDGATMFGEGYYAIGNGALVQAESSESSLSSYRWYLSVTDRFGNPRKLGRVNIAVFGSDDDTDGIEEMEGQTPETAAAIYDMSGRRVTSPLRGMYIMNGKKYLVK